MKVSTRGEYGVRAMVALAKHYGEGPASISTLAQESSVPYSYLEQLIAPLKKSGLVTSRRGAAGGYQLARSPEQIGVGEIYRAMEGPIAPMECVSEDVTEQTCPLIPNCETRPVWIEVRNSIASTLDSMTLADLLRQGAAGKTSAPKLSTVAG
ncbi:MAG: Rrf2 family transcriptional regulator [Thermomicrobiales bacterium]|nr:Rrf2 family transcriptional regulator [Thermomicrobiales bacterium]